MLVERVYYPIKKLLDRDPDNHQYNSYLVKGHSFREYYNRSLDDIFVHSADLVIDKENTVYMPLHFTPEASTSYWCDEVDSKRLFELCAEHCGRLRSFGYFSGQRTSCYVWKAPSRVLWMN